MRSRMTSTTSLSPTPSTGIVPFSDQQQEDAATKVQALARRQSAKKRVELLREEEARDQGVLVACPGTVQGMTGWYASYVNGPQWFLTVDRSDSWNMIAGPYQPEVWAEAVQRNRAMGADTVPIQGHDGLTYFIDSKNRVVRVQKTQLLAADAAGGAGEGGGGVPEA